MQPNQEDPHWKTKKVDHFVIVNKLLGKGQYGLVFRGYLKDDPNQQVAVKAIPKKIAQDSFQLQQHIQREIAILSKINNPHIVKLLHVTKTASNIYMFLEYCKDGDLAEFLAKKQDKRLSELEAVVFFKHVMSGFRELNAANIIHRDIKPSNILLHEGLAKIADFGFARYLEGTVPPMELSRVGSPIYMAPQILEGTPFTAKCDIWSLGVMFYELLYGVTPWIAFAQVKLLEKIRKYPLKFPEIPVRSQKVKQLISCMLRYEEAERIDWADLFNHEIVRINEQLIQYNMQQIQNQQDKLMRSVSMNKIYMESNLFMGYCNDSIKLEDEQSKPMEIESTDIIQHYENEEQEQKIISVLDLICKYERNMAFFYNYVIQNLFAALQHNLLPFSQDLCFQLIFLICKNHIIKMNDLYKNITKNTSHEYKVYLKSKEFKIMNRAISIDIDQSQKFFVEILRKCLSLQSSANQVALSEQTKEFYQQYLQVLDNNLVTTDQFQQAYVGTIMNTMNRLTDSYEHLKLRYFLLICLNHKLVFANPNYDFSKFYEDLQHITIDQLRSLLADLSKRQV